MENTNGLNVDEVAGDLIKRELVKVVKQLSGFENVELSIEPGSKKGDNFIGEIFRVLFKSSDENEEPKQKSIILKMAPKLKIRREKMRVRDLFLGEISMYEEVLHFFNEFQLSKGINPKVDGFNEIAKCYSSIRDEMSESLFLEDLNLRQFEMINLRKEPLTFEHMSLVMKALGKFHAISFALKDQQPEKFEQLKNLANEKYWTMFETVFKRIFDGLFKNLAGCLEEEKRFDLFEKLKLMAGDDPSAMALNLASASLAEPYAVICHGDVTSNNSMFRKNEQGEPIEVQIIDWQFCRYASPVTELVMYLLCTTTKELRAKHYDDFLKIYHGSLSDLLNRLGSDPQKLFPFEALLEQCRKFGAYAAFVSTMLMPMLWSDRDSIPDIDSVAENIGSEDALKDDVFSIGSVETKRFYNKKVTDMIDDMIRLGYI